MLVENVSETRWWTAPPGSDESLLSTLNRAASLYRRTADELWESLNRDDPRPSGPIDAPNANALRRMAKALGTPAASLYSHRQPDAPWLLTPVLRDSYCLHCWNDWPAQRPVGMLRSWSFLLRTRCPIHNYPLLRSPLGWETTTERHFWVPELTSGDWAILDLIEEFGNALEKSLFLRSPWPQGWCGTTHLARRILSFVSANVGPCRDHAPTGLVQPESSDLRYMVRGSKKRLVPVKDLCWEMFCLTPDPAHRRAALWLAAWELIPGLPEHLFPERFSLGTPHQSGQSYFRDRLGRMPIPRP